MTPALTELMEKLAHKYAHEQSHHAGNRMRFSDGFKAGFTSAIEHVSKDCEFDVCPLENYLNKNPPQPWETWKDHAETGAKWQFDQMSARVGLAEQHTKIAYAAIDKTQEIIKHHAERAESLETKLAQALQEIERLKK